MVREDRNYAQIDDPGTPAGAGSFDPKEQIRSHRRRGLIITTIALTTALTALVALSLPPRYVTVASVLLEQSRQNLIDSSVCCRREHGQLIAGGRNQAFAIDHLCAESRREAQPSVHPAVQSQAA